MTTTQNTSKSYRKQLYNGGELFINKLGSLYVVDVFGLDSELTDDPVYHACYATFDEAMDDAELWKEWPIY